MLTRPGNSEAEAMRCHMSYKINVYECLRSHINFSVPSVPITDRILLNKQQKSCQKRTCNVNYVISMTENEAMRTTFVRTRPALHDDEAKTGCYEAQAKNFGPEATLATRT